MLILDVLGDEYLDESTNEFVHPDRKTIRLEHSLVALSKWEQKFHKPFLSADEKTGEEVLYYVRCMVVDDTPPETFLDLSEKNLIEINEYINDPMTATWVSNPPVRKKANQIITAELIYSWMINFGISIEYQTWHLNQLFMLIRVRDAQTQDPAKAKKVPHGEMAASRREENARRRAMHNTNG